MNAAAKNPATVAPAATSAHMPTVFRLLIGNLNLRATSNGQ
jgi:hypothetical protein